MDRVLFSEFAVTAQTEVCYLTHQMRNSVRFSTPRPSNRLVTLGAPFCFDSSASI
jgi:hypothetical protein